MPGMTLASRQIAILDNGKLILRDTPLRLRWTFDSLVTSDQHGLRCAFEASVRAVDQSTDRQMLQEVFLAAEPALSADQVVRHFEPALRRAAASLADEHPADEWIDGKHTAPLIDALKSAVKPVAFACGLELLPPFHVELESPSLQRQKIEVMIRAREQQRTAEQVEQLKRAGELLRQFEATRQSMPELTAGKLIEHVGAADRGPMLEALLVASADTGGPRPLHAVAGPNLVRIDLSVPTPIVSVESIPTDLGPLRSVQADVCEDQRVLLIGARAGVMMLDADKSDPAKPDRPPLLFRNGAVRSELGYNGAVLSGGRVWASHSDAGLVAWTVGTLGQPVVSLPEFGRAAGGAGAKHVRAVDDRYVVFAAGERSVIVEEDRPTVLDPASAAEVIGIVPDAACLWLVHADGTLAVLDRATRRIARTDRRPGQFAAVASLPFLGSLRLLLACDDGAVECVGTDDALITRYFSPHRAIRMLGASHAWIAGVSPDRQRLILWRPWDGRKPAHELYLTGQTRHRVADIEFG